MGIEPIMKIKFKNKNNFIIFSLKLLKNYLKTLILRLFFLTFFGARQPLKIFFSNTLYKTFLFLNLLLNKRRTFFLNLLGVVRLIISPPFFCIISKGFLFFLLTLFDFTKFLLDTFFEKFVLIFK